MVQSFGGSWTEQKLEVIGGYLDSYTTALKNRPFNLIYVDAFAGEGQWRPKDEDRQYAEVRDGSARIALKVDDRPFDRLVFIELDPDRCGKLMSLKSAHPNRRIEVRNEDANTAIASICRELQSNDRIVVFLDPFATSVAWSTVEELAATKRADCWILFPVGAVLRQMPREKAPQQHEREMLDFVFGGREHWESLYRIEEQVDFWGERRTVRSEGTDPVANRYHDRLRSVFAQVAPNRWMMRNSRGAPLFALFFAAANPNGAPIAVRLAENRLLRAMER